MVTNPDTQKSNGMAGLASGSYNILVEMIDYYKGSYKEVRYIDGPDLIW